MARSGVGAAVRARGSGRPDLHAFMVSSVPPSVKAPDTDFLGAWGGLSEMRCGRLPGGESGSPLPQSEDTNYSCIRTRDPRLEQGASKQHLRHNVPERARLRPDDRAQMPFIPKGKGGEQNQRGHLDDISCRHEVPLQPQLGRGDGCPGKAGSLGWGTWPQPFGS